MLFSSTFLEVRFLLATNQSCSLSVEHIVSEFYEQPAEVITDEDDENEDKEFDEQNEHPWRNEVDAAVKTWNRLSLFTEESGFDPLISKPTRIINQPRRDKCGSRQWTVYLKSN